jgi:TonB family protein
MASETIAQANTAAAGGVKTQPVAMEIPVTVNGASTVAGSDKRQPFSETTQTVLVFGSGAVIRLAAAVGPGQLLFVTNEKSKQEIVCQVVKTKQNGNGIGYVELKFTEATADFWGIRAPGNGAAASAPGALSVGAMGASTKPLEQKSPDGKIAPPATEASAVAKPTPPAAVQAPAAPAPAQPAAQASEIEAAPIVPAPPSPGPKVPTLSEFLTHGSNGLELKTRDKLPTAPIENRESATNPPIAEKPLNVSLAARQISSDDNQPSLSVALGVSQSPAPGSASFDLSADLPAEEVKIPAWLEPLARNTAAFESKPAEERSNEANAGAAALELHLDDRVPSSGLSEALLAPEAAPALAGEGRTPNFGSSLSLGSTEGAARSGKGWKIALAVAALVLAAAAAWYWFVNQAPKVSAGGIGTVAESHPESIPAPDMSNPASARPSTTNSENLSAAPSLEPASATLSGARPNGAGGTLPSASAPMKNPSSSNLADRPEEVAAEPAKKPTFGKLRLAPPKMTQNAAGEESGAADPGLLMNGATAADSSGASLLANKGKGPSAPLPIGGDVKVARLISSVPPVYPQMARSQRVGGEVTIDALIDVAGHVTATRVLSGPALLHDAATNAVKQWKYQPATLNGVPTATHLTVTVQFKLQ